jgi:Flp pilus assembly protein TadG
MEPAQQFNNPVLLTLRGLSSDPSAMFAAAATMSRAIKTAACRFGLRGFVRAQSGTAAIEFGLVAVPFLAILFAIIETALVFFASQALEYAVAQSGRLIMTGQADTAGYDQSTFKKAVCANVVVLFDCQNKLYVNVQNYTKFANASTTPPYDSNGQLDTSKMAYQPGQPGDVVVVSFYYQWPVYVSLLGNDLSNQNGGKRLLAATSVFRNEPYK